MVDPFWHKVAEAYDRVSINTDETIEIEMNGKHAVVGWSFDGFVGINIYDVPVEKPTLIQP